MNWTMGEYGGESPESADEAHCEHYVYLAVKPLAQRPEGEAAAASAHQHEEHIGEGAAAASAHQHDEHLGGGAGAASTHQHEWHIGDMTRNRSGTGPCPFTVAKLGREITDAGWTDEPTGDRFAAWTV